MALTEIVPALPISISAAESGEALVFDATGRARNRRLSFWDVTWSGAVAYPEGTAYASMVDSSAAIQTAIAQAAALGVPVRGCGRFRVDATITLAIDADFTGATWVCSSTSLAPLLRIGTTTSGQRVRKLRVVAPKVINAAKSGAGWTGTSVGIELCNVQECTELDIPHIEGFTTGLLMTAIGSGTVHNVIALGQLHQNKQQQVIRPQAGGWVNQNEFHGGRLSFDSSEGTNVAGTRDILIDMNGVFTPNANVWHGTSIEGNVPEYHVESIAGQYNVFDHCRWEATTPKVFWNEDPTDGATWYSTFNEIDGGYNASAIVETFSTNSRRNQISAPSKSVRAGSSSLPIMRPQNANGATAPHLAGYAADVNPNTAGVNDYSYDLSQTYLRGKRTADAHPRARIDFANGYAEFGDGTNPPSGRINLKAADVVGTADSDSFQTGNGQWNGGLLKLGPSLWMWDDGTGPRFKRGSAPTSATDGAVMY